ncbi:MAG: shikimate kinase [Solirubrobacteraceae bacterium]|jgi:shikimate kinase
MSVAPPPARHIVLIGLMGVGKTTIGRLLAARLGWPLADSDGEIEAREGATVRELQERRGADALHSLEAQVLLEALARAEPSVIAAAASTVEDERCARALSAGGVSTVWLQAKLATLVARYDSDPHRPRYRQGTAAALREQLAAREQRFAAVATVRIDVDGLAPAEVLERVEGAIAQAR